MRRRENPGWFHDVPVVLTGSDIIYPHSRPQRGSGCSNWAVCFQSRDPFMHGGHPALCWTHGLRAETVHDEGLHWIVASLSQPHLMQNRAGLTRESVCSMRETMNCSNLSLCWVLGQAGDPSSSPTLVFGSPSMTGQWGHA